MVGALVSGCRCATSWCDLDVTKVLSRLYLGKTIRYRKLSLGRDIGWGCRCAKLWCDLDLTFDLAVVTLTCKILSGYISETIRCRKVILGRDIG